MILYGGGWNSQRDPVDKKLVKPYYGYYGLEAMESPWKFKVVEAAQKIPAPDRSAHKGWYSPPKPAEKLECQGIITVFRKILQLHDEHSRK